MACTSCGTPTVLADVCGNCKARSYGYGYRAFLKLCGAVIFVFLGTAVIPVFAVVAGANRSMLNAEDLRVASVFTALFYALGFSQFCVAVYFAFLGAHGHLPPVRVAADGQYRRFSSDWHPEAMKATQRALAANGVVAAAAWMVLIAALLFWLPLVGPFIAGIVGGRKARTVGVAILAALLPALLLGLAATAIASAVSSLPLIGALAGALAAVGILAHSGPLLLGAIVGAAIAR